MPRRLVILQNIFLFNKSSSYSDKKYPRLIMQPAIQLAPTHLLQNVGSSITIILPLFLSIPNQFFLGGIASALHSESALFDSWQRCQMSCGIL
jgi:hypothetical protein